MYTPHVPYEGPYLKQTVYKDGQCEGYQKIRSEHCDHPLVIGCSKGVSLASPVV